MMSERMSGPAGGEVSAFGGAGETMTRPIVPDNVAPFAGGGQGRGEMSRTSGMVPLDTYGPVGVGRPGGGYDGYAGRDMTDATTWHRGPHIASGGMFTRLHQETEQ